MITTKQPEEDWVLLCRHLIHHLVNPMMAMRMQICCLEDSEEEEVREICGQLESSLLRLEKILERTRLILRATPATEADWTSSTDTANLMADLIRLFPSLTVDLKKELFEELAMSPAHWVTVFEELAQNAKESDAGTLSLYREGKDWIVEDDGSPFAFQSPQQSLVPFYSTKENHVGLGLNLARYIVRFYGAELTVQPDTSSRKGVRIVLHAPEKR